MLLPSCKTILLLHIGNTHIENVKAQKLLGIYIDNTLSIDIMDTSNLVHTKDSKFENITFETIILLYNS